MPFGSNYVRETNKRPRFYNKILGFPLYLGDRVRASHVVRLLNPNPGDIILDAGCGIGVYSLEYVLKGAQVIGVDVSDERIRQAHTALKALGMIDQASFVIADICNLPMKNGVFNKISCVDVLEHIKNDLESVAEFKRVLEDRGVLVVHVPQTGSTYTILSFFNKKFDFKIFGHVREGYTLNLLNKLIDTAGLTVKGSEETFRKFAGLAWQINYIVRYSMLGSVLFPILYFFSKLDFLSKGKGKGLLLVAMKCSKENSTSNSKN